jgi:hypothetical protein
MMMTDDKDNRAKLRTSPAIKHSAVSKDNRDYGPVIDGIEKRED